MGNGHCVDLGNKRPPHCYAFGGAKTEEDCKGYCSGDPNCEAYEEDGRVYIHALHPIEPGQELNYNYALIYDERHTPALKKKFACRCGTPGCSGTMLAPKRRQKKKT